MKIQVDVTYFAGTNETIDLPGVEDLSQLEYWYIKWHTFHYLIRGEESPREYPLDDGSMLDAIDMKRPATVDLFGFDKDGEPDYSEALDGYE